MNQFNFPNHYVDGQWRTPLAGRNHAVINPATEAEEGSIQLGSAADVDRAVAAAKKAFESYSVSTIAERKALLASVVEVYERRYDDIALAISTEMGAPLEQLAKPAQAGAGIAHLNQTIALLDTFNFESDKGEGRLMREPVGVCALITPWNWPINQITCKVAPALAAGCTMVLKPSEVAPLSAHIFAEILDEAGVPAGVFNLVDGDGPTVGAALSAHHDIDMVSFTGSTRAGTAISRAAADTVKRVSLELGGKSANVVLDDCNLEEAITRSVLHMMNNTGQSCNAPSRMLVPKTLLEQAEQIAADACASLTVGNPNDKATTTGPLSSEMQFNKVQSLIEKGIEEGAKLVCGGPGRPNGLDSGYYAQPTVFSDVNNQMTIAREEIFGPVLCMLPYDNEEQAIAIANDTPYGLAGYVQATDINRARQVARRLRVGNISINGAAADACLPFGGYKQSGNGREWGEFGLEEFLEVKAVVGFHE